MATPRRPDPEPLPTNDLTVVVLGTLLWAVALLAAVILRGRLDDQGRGGWVWVAAAGLFLGLVGIRHLRRTAARRRVRNGHQSMDQAFPNKS